MDERPNAWVLSLTGDLDYARVRFIPCQHRPRCEGRPGCVIVDLSALDYLDSSVLGAPLQLEGAGRKRRKLVLVTNETVENILSLTRLSGIFATATNLADAEAMTARA